MTKPILFGMFAFLIHCAQAEASARCTADTRSHAEQLLRLFFGADDDRMGINDEVIQLKPIKNPKGKGVLDVEEVWGSIYKTAYRMRFIYQQGGDGCVLVGQEIIEDTDL